jgi:DDE superfamily endonuclease
VPLEDTEKLRKLAEGFALSRRTQNPLFGVVGFFDGIALKITKPDDAHVPRNYWCRKGYYAIPVQAIVDSSYIFMNMSAMAVGSTHDSLAFSLSKLGIALEHGGLPDGYWIAADAAYECSNCIISPCSEQQIKDPENGVARDALNYYQSSSRVHVEQAFGILVSRFGILWRILRFKRARAPRILAVCTRIHNHCIDTGSPSVQAGLSTAHSTSLNIFFERWRQASNEIRRDIAAESGQGRRTDRERYTLRETLTDNLKSECVSRPVLFN